MWPLLLIKASNRPRAREEIKSLHQFCQAETQFCLHYLDVANADPNHDRAGLPRAELITGAIKNK